MTGQQHDEWLSVHRGYFPGLESWLKGLPENERVSVVATWRSYLSGLTLDAAKAASKQLYEQEKPPIFGDHPKHLMRIAKTIERTQREFRDRNRVSAGLRRCLFCQDSGCTSLFAVVSMSSRGRQILLGGEDIVSHINRFGFHYRPNPTERETENGIDNGSETLTCVGGACWCDAGARLKNLPRLNESRIAFPFCGTDEKFWTEMRRKFEPF